MSYFATGDVPEGPTGLTEAERKLAKADPDVLDFEFRKRNLQLRQAEVKAARSSAFWESLQALTIVALPIAAFFGIEKFLGLKRR